MQTRNIALDKSNLAIRVRSTELLNNLRRPTLAPTDEINTRRESRSNKGAGSCFADAAGAADWEGWVSRGGFVGCARLLPKTATRLGPYSLRVELFFCTVSMETILICWLKTNVQGYVSLHVGVLVSAICTPAPGVLALFTSLDVQN